MNKTQLVFIIAFLLLRSSHAQTIKASDLLRYVNCADTACIKDVYKKGFRFSEKRLYVIGIGEEYIYEAEADSVLSTLTTDVCGTTIGFSFRDRPHKGQDDFITYIRVITDDGSIYYKLLNEFKEKKFVAKDTIPLDTYSDWQSEPSIRYSSSNFKKIFIEARTFGVQPCYEIEITRL